MVDALTGCLGRLLPSEQVQRLLQEEVEGEEGVRKAREIRTQRRGVPGGASRADTPACDANLTLNCTLRRVAWGYLGRTGAGLPSWRLLGPGRRQPGGVIQRAAGPTSAECNSEAPKGVPGAGGQTSGAYRAHPERD